ncbi:uncharacterized protein LOC144149387 [Haemaphysalis longicornis]
MEVRVGERFNSYDEFETALHRFGVQTNTLFVKERTKSVAVVNASLTANSVKLDSKLQFANATFTCKHGGRRRTTGTGIRPNQRTMKRDCPVQVVIAAKRASQQLEITSAVLEHNHATTKEMFDSYPECRRFDDEEKEFVEPLLEMKVRPSMILQRLNEKTGKAHITKDLHNLKQQKNRDDAAQLMAAIAECRRKDNAKIIPVTDESQELQILYIQTPHMRKAFDAFPEVLLLDATYRTNKLRMPLFVFVVEDGAGRSHVVAYAFVASEQQHVVTKLLDIFVKENTAASKTSVVVVDKDFTEISAVRESFPSKPAVQLCQFHVTKAFKIAAGQHAKSAQERDRLVSSFNDMLCAPTSQLFEEAHAEFLRYASEDARIYFEKNWAKIPEMWARHLCDTSFTAGNNTTNRVESHNGKLKNILSSHEKLHDALRSLLNISDSLLQEARHQAALLQTCEFYSYNTSGDVEKMCFKELTPYACALVSTELTKVRENPPEIRQLADNLYSVSSACGNTWHEVSTEKQTCSCTTFSRMGLLCRHFLATCEKYGIMPDLKTAIKARWFKSYQLDYMAKNTESGSSQQPSEICPNEEIATMPAPSYEKMNRSQRFNFAMRTFKTMADHLADCPTDIFTARLGLLEEIHTGWLKGQDIIMATDNSDVGPDLGSTGQAPCHQVATAEALGQEAQQEHRTKTSSPEYGNANSMQPCQEASSSSAAAHETHSSLHHQVCQDFGLPTLLTLSRLTCLVTITQIKLPVVKSRGRPRNRPVQRKCKRPRDASSTHPVAFEHLSEVAQHKLLLTGIVGEAVSNRVLSQKYTVEKTDVEVRPELLPSALLDCRVKFLKLKKYFSKDAWALLTSSVAMKKADEAWLCRICNEKDDGQTKMVCCDHCLEWFHWPCGKVTKADVKQSLWFCCHCKEI